MPAFKQPKGAYLYKKNHEWVKVAKYGFQSPNRVWGEYWHRFNTITIPLMDEDAYFADALGAARRASDREHLEQLLSEKYDERRRDLEKLLSKIAMDTFLPEGGPLPEAIGSAALKAGQTGSFDSFLEALCGLVYGWEGKGGDGAEKPPQVCARERRLTPSLTRRVAMLAGMTVTTSETGPIAAAGTLSRKKTKRSTRLASGPTRRPRQKTRMARGSRSRMLQSGARRMDRQFNNSCRTRRRGKVEMEAPVSWPDRRQHRTHTMSCLRREY